MEALPLHLTAVRQKRRKRHGDTRLLTVQLLKYHLTTKAPKCCGRIKRKKNLCCCFAVLVFLHVFFKSPSRYWWGRSYIFLKLWKYLGKRCHPRTLVGEKKLLSYSGGRKGGDSAGLQFSTVFLQSESVHSSFSSLKILKCLSFTLQTSVLADSLKWMKGFNWYL